MYHELCDSCHFSLAMGKKEGHDHNHIRERVQPCAAKSKGTGCMLTHVSHD
jgi:hypothetical protein